MSRLTRFWQLYLRRHAVWYAFGVVFLVATNALTVAIPGFVKHAIDALSAGEPPRSAIRYAWAILGAGLGIIVVRTLSRTFFFNPGRTVEFHLKNALFDRVLALPRRFFERMRPGEIISRGTNDANSVRALAGFATLQLFNVVLMLALTFGRMVALDLRLTLVCGIPLVLAALILRSGVRVMFTLTIEGQQQVATLSDRILETYNGVSVVHAFGAMPGVLERFDEANERMLAIGLGLARVRAWLLPVVSVVGSLCVVLLLWVGGRMVVAGTLSLGDLAAFSVYINILVTGLTSLGWLVNAVQRGYISLGRVDDVLYAEIERPEVRHALPPPPAAGHGFEVRDLSFTHPDAPPDAPPVLDRLSFRVAPGETLGVFGLTGTGKSTLLDLLSRVRDPQPGAVRLDGVDVRDVDVRDYWQRVAYVTQDPYLFSETIRENITLGEGDTDAEAAARALEAADAAELSQDLSALPDGLDTIVGERGVTLSGGQRQRVALARAFYRDFDVLLLDDVLSAVDHATEGRLIDAIYRRIDAGRRRTAVVVSHRVSVLARADRVIVLDGGRIVAEGAHDALIAMDGPYAHAWRLQRAADALEDPRAEPELVPS
ncbi:MAG: ABC transporter ATP-binding protein [Deltaproteobacteria bacterium]|nr:ABC transporter ATP-binding protein [Deltaproteobacteria bacterium]